MISMSFKDVSYLFNGLTKCKEDANGDAYLSDPCWGKDGKTSLHIFVAPCENGAWYCFYNLTFYGQELKSQNESTVYRFEENLKKFAREMRSLKTMYIDK